MKDINNKDNNNNNTNKITIRKRTLVISIAVIVSLSVFLVVSGPLSSLTLSPILKQAGAQQQPSSQPQQPSSQPQQPAWAFIEGLPG